MWAAHSSESSSLKKQSTIKDIELIHTQIAIIPVIAMLIGKYHGICAILFGIVFFIFTYCDKNKPSPGLTIDYSWHLGGYEAGILAIAYGLIRFCE